MKQALVVVDVQRDFCPGGALGVPGGDEVVPVLNRYMERFARAGLPVIATRDWHPAETKHFADRGGVWPPHCIQGTRGADFCPGLHLPPNAIVVSKGVDPETQGYSAMEAVAADGTPFPELLRRLGVDHIYVGGLATDYCVKNTVLDAIPAGIAVTVLIDAVRGVNLQPGDSERALTAALNAGADFTTLERLKLGNE